MPTRTTVYFTEPDVARLKRLIETTNLPGTSAACQVGLVMLEAAMNGECCAMILDRENVKPKRKEGIMDYTIDSQKLEEVIALFNKEVDPAATDDLIQKEICADWNEGAEHQAWIDSAPVSEIVDWLASFYEN